MWVKLQILFEVYNGNCLHRFIEIRKYFKTYKSNMYNNLRIAAYTIYLYIHWGIKLLGNNTKLNDYDLIRLSDMWVSAEIPINQLIPTDTYQISISIY